MNVMECIENLALLGLIQQLVHRAVNLVLLELTAIMFRPRHVQQYQALFLLQIFLTLVQ